MVCLFFFFFFFVCARVCVRVGGVESMVVALPIHTDVSVPSYFDDSRWFSPTDPTSTPKT